METLFELEDQYKNSLKDFDMTVDYSLKYLTTDGNSIPALSGTTDKGSAMYDPSTLPNVPANFKCSQLTTNVQCEFYRVDQKERELTANDPKDVKIPAQKKKITAQQRAERVQSKVVAKTQALQNRFSAATAVEEGRQNEEDDRF
jgi:hypothetical protein